MNVPPTRKPPWICVTWATRTNNVLVNFWVALVPFVAVETPRGRLWMELDTGSTGALIVGRHAANVLGLDAANRDGQSTAITLAGGVDVQAKARVEDLIIDGNIGAPILRQWAVTIDLANERLWIDASPARDRTPP